MKKLIAATFALAAVAPLAAKADSFTGAYVGLGMDVNAASAQVTVSDNRSGTDTTNQTSRSNAGATLWGGSLFGGYGKCFNQFYVGGELGLDLQGGEMKFSEFQTNSTPGTIISQKLSRGLSVSPTVRLGYMIAPKTLAFLKLGTAATSFKQNVSDTLNTPTVSISKSKLLWGLTVGAGMETCISSHLRLRVEYIRTMYPAFTNSTTTALAAETGPYSIKSKPVDNIFRLGVSYAF